MCIRDRSGLFPLLNSFGNSRLAGLHGSDFMQLIASGLCFGFGFGILLSLIHI